LDRQFVLDLAASHQRMPIGTDLVLREKPDQDQIVLDGEALGAVVAEAAQRYKTPLAIPLMDLTIEKSQMLSCLGVPAAARDTHHLGACPTEADKLAVDAGFGKPLTPRLAANVGAVRYVAEKTDLVPCGMCIGPFSLMVKLLDDPISAVYVAGTGATGDEEPDVRTVEETLDLCVRVITGSIRAQAAAGAKMIVVAEPAANLVYISPKQLARGSDVFERLVMRFDREVVATIRGLGMLLFFHCCGELTDDMVRAFASLDPDILSLGSSRKLWEDAALVPKTTVLFGNLPTKRFYADDLTIEDVEALAGETCRRMRDAGHPHILGSECDVLSVPERHAVITAKVAAFMSCVV
jgi:uroporphyrinogen-III decarboxylase